LRIAGLPAPVQNVLLSALLPKVAEFAMAEPPAPPPPPATPANQPVSVQMLVTLASAEPAIDRRRRIAIDADRGLDALTRLNEAMLAGTPAIEQLHEVAAWSAGLDLPQSPELADILKEIDLRVRVELAKHNLVV
jgi:hypothetical protein